MTAIERISPEVARQKVVAGQALLVCAYQAYDKFLKYQLAGAVSLSDLHARESDLARDREIIFY